MNPTQPPIATNELAVAFNISAIQCARNFKDICAVPLQRPVSDFDDVQLSILKKQADKITTDAKIVSDNLKAVIVAERKRRKELSKNIKITLPSQSTCEVIRFEFKQETDLNSKEGCVICTSDKFEVGQKVVRLVCSHMFCEGCIDKWFYECKLQQRPCKCPTCKSPIKDH